MSCTQWPRLALTLTMLLLLLGPTLAASGQTVWRCGNDGRSYSDMPCPGGRAVDVADVRDADQRAQAQQVAVREQQLVQHLRQERGQRLREAQALGQGAAGIKPAAAAASPVAGGPQDLRRPPRHSKRRTDLRGRSRARH